jgi:hypothetical protein
MFSRKWIVAGAFALTTAAVAFVETAPDAAAARRGANLICRANGKVFKAIPKTIQGTYSKIGGAFVLSSSKYAVNIARRSVSFKSILLAGTKTGLADGTTTLPVDLDTTISSFVNAPHLALGATAADAPAWAGENDEVTITIRSWKNGKKRVKQDGKFVLVDVAKVHLTFSGSLPPGDNNAGAPNMELTKGTAQATVYVGD